MQLFFFFKGGGVFSLVIYGVHIFCTEKQFLDYFWWGRAIFSTAVKGLNAFFQECITHL